MRSIVRNHSILLVTVLALGAAACGDAGDEPDDDTPIVVEEGGPIALDDSAAMTPSDQEVQVVDEPRVVERTVVVRERPAPRREEPAPVDEPAGEPSVVTPARTSSIPSGTRVPIEILAQIDSENHDVGDAWTGRVTRDVVVGGTVVIPAGAAVSGVVTAIDEGDASDGAGAITLEARSVETVAGTRSIATAPVAAGRSYRDQGFPAKETAIGAGAGAAIGAVVGGKKGAAIGAAAGGAGGAAMGSQRRDYEVAVAAGTTFTLRIQQPVSL